MSTDSSMNARRRHLTPSQTAPVALDILPLMEKEAKERQGTRTDISQRIDEGDEGRATEKAAAMVGTNRQYVSDAKNLQKTSPDLLDQVRASARKGSPRSEARAGTPQQSAT